MGLNDHSSSFQSPTAHLLGTAMAGGALIVAATAAGVVSVILSWAEEAVSSGKIVINATATGIADVIETTFATAESVIREFGSCMNRIAGTSSS